MVKVKRMIRHQNIEAFIKIAAAAGRHPYPKVGSEKMNLDCLATAHNKGHSII